MAWNAKTGQWEVDPVVTNSLTQVANGGVGLYNKYDLSGNKLNEDLRTAVRDIKIPGLNTRNTGLGPVAISPQEQYTNDMTFSNEVGANDTIPGTPPPVDSGFSLSKLFGLDSSSSAEKGTPTDWGMKGMGGTLLGAGQLGLGILGYLDDRKTTKMQRGLLGQQLESNQYALDNDKAYRSALKDFGNPTK